MLNLAYLEDDDDAIFNWPPYYNFFLEKNAHILIFSCCKLISFFSFVGLKAIKVVACDGWNDLSSDI